MSSDQHTFIDLFSGAGGMSFGFSAHPSFRPVAAVDAQIGKPSSGAGALACNQTYETNVGIRPIEADLSVYKPQELLRDAPIPQKGIDVLLSCAPCTGFSRTLRENHLQDDPRNALVVRSADFVEALRPRIFVMENARELIQGNFSHHYQTLCDRLVSLGYTVCGAVEMLSDFGLPQYRERAIIVAAEAGIIPRSLADLWSHHRPLDRCTTVRAAIADLPPVSAGEAHPEDRMHVSPRVLGPTLERLQALPHDGGSWVDLLRHRRADDLLIPSMKRAAARGAFGSYPDVYGRMWWDRPSATIKRECAHVGNGRYSHPEQNRMCTARELALLNGFPREYVFSASSLSNKYRHIGDAVPPLIAFQLAHVCNWMLSGRRPSLSECVLPNTSLRCADILEDDSKRTLFDPVPTTVPDA